jgi:AcrR family transcriptional regulator
MRRRRDTTSRVLEAATALFAARGYAETSMSMIAEAAGVSVGTLYNLFDSKEALYSRLIEGKAREIADRLNRALSTGATLDARLENFLAEKLAAFREEAVFIRLYYQVNAHARFSLRASLPEEAAHLYESTTSALVDALRSGIDAGVFKLAVSPERVAVCYQALTTELFLLHLEAPHAHPADAVLKSAVALVRAGLADTKQHDPAAERTNPKESSQ